jgi:hypothetical protein
MSKITVAACAYHHTTDIDPTASVDSNDYDRLANTCVIRATTALERTSGKYNELHRYHLASIFHSMMGTHRTVRTVLENSAGASEATDVLALARLQLEGLYAVCLMLESPHYIDWYLQDYWRKLYVQFLLLREECNALPRWHDYIGNTPILIAALRDYVGVTQTQQLTVDYEELGTPIPPGVKPQAIPQFPTPGRTIGKINDASKRRMLERLYPEYVHLCSFAHGLAEATFVKRMFDKRSPHRDLLTDSQRKETFQKKILGPSFTMSFLCILQSTAELTVLYPNDMELIEVIIKGWNSLSEFNLLGKVVWGIRTSKLLGVLT